MFASYNRKGLGDVLIVPLKTGEATERKTQVHGDVVKITDAEGQLYGYNIFQASKYISLDQDGYHLIDAKLLEEIQGALKANGLEESLDLDTSPKFVIGHVVERSQHPDADKLSVCQVDLGDETVQIVCGAANVAANQKVVVAKVGATMPGGLEIKPSKLRGEDSHGMICSRQELGLEEDPEEKGIYVLDADAEVGQPFSFKA